MFEQIAEERQIPVIYNPPTEELQLSPSLYMSVKFQRPGNTSKLTKGERDLVLRRASEDGVDPALLKATKTLWESSAFDKIVSFDKERQAMLNKWALPATKILRSGFYRIGVGEVEQWHGQLSLWQDQRMGLVDVFGGEYAQVREVAIPSLGPLYRPEQYLTRQQMQESFGMSWCFFSLCIPQELKEASEAAANESQALLSSLTEETLEECRVALRYSFYDLVKRAAERLKVREDGKKEVFRDSLVTGMEEFLDTFSKRNAITGDKKLAELVAEARAVFSQVQEPNELRTKLQLRERVQRTMAEVQETMEQGLMLASEVSIDLDN